MRKSLRLLLALLASSCFILPLQAQTSKGSMLLGGSLSYSQTTHKSSSNSTNEGGKTTYRGFGIQPDLGFFLADNLAIGTGLEFKFGRDRSNEITSAKGHTFGIAPFIRYYKFFGDKLALFGQGGFGYSKYTSKRIDPYAPDNSTQFQTNRSKEALYTYLRPGLSYFATSWLGFQFTLGQLQYAKTDTENFYSHSGENSKQNTTEKSLTADFGFGQASLGINFFLTK